MTELTSTFAKTRRFTWLIQLFSGPVRSEGGFTTVQKMQQLERFSQPFPHKLNITSLDANKLSTEAGTGITGGTGTIYRSSVMRQGGIITTRILIDLTGLRSTASGDIIGVNGTSNVFI